jgi:hypothetical protein
MKKIYCSTNKEIKTKNPRKKNIGCGEIGIEKILKIKL